MRQTLAVITPALLWAAQLAAQSVPPVVEFPVFPLGPSVVALGGAGAGWSPDAAASLNPATLFNAPRISVYHYEGFADYGGDYAAGSLRLLGRFAIGAGLRRLGWDRIIEDDLGVPTSGLRTGDAQYSVSLAFAPVRQLQIGVSAARLLSENLGVRISATAWSFGTLVTYARAGQAGLALLHAGSPARSSAGETYALPSVVRLGIQQGLLQRFTVVLDGAMPTRDSEAWTAHAGVEWRAPAFVVLRAGVESLASSSSVERETRLASGLGLVVGPLEVSLTTRFGGIAGSQEWFVGLDALRPRPR